MSPRKKQSGNWMPVGKKDAVMQELLSKNHVLSEQTGGRKNADRGYPLLQ